MSRNTKWKLEKAKVKVVFRLQFHATQIPQSGWEKLFISFIPNETGKATAKTSKANVRNGACKWADPIYETTRLLLDSKSKQYDDKLYKLVVGMGTSRSSILGEATINLSDYAEASQPSSINLPLHGSDHGTILHVTVQLLTAKTGFREFEQQRDKGLQRESEPSTVKSQSLDLQIPDDQLNKVKAQRQVRPHFNVDETGIHEEYSDSQVTCDDSSNTSENYKNDPSITHEVDSFKNMVSEKRNGSDDLAIAYEENQRLRGSLEVAESSISELKMEVNTLQNHANEMTTETQKLQQDLATEIASSQELMKEVTVLKSECSKFKNDLQQLKEMKSTSMLDLGEIPNIPFQEPIDSSHSELLRELDIAKSEKESLVNKMEQMECYYEALVQDLEENQKKILGELQSHKKDMNDQMIRFNEERHELSSINKDLQKRATTSESALKRARLNYSIAVSQLQKDLDMLSFQVLSMFETNQTVIKEAFSDSSEGHEDLVDDHRSKHLSGDLKKSLNLQENIYKKVEEELGEMCASNLYLEVFSGTLKGTLLEACVHIRKTKEKLQELEVSNESRDVLFMRLQNVTEDVHALNAQNSYYLEKCNDLQLQNELLEKDLGNVSRENFLLMEKITECEALLMDYKVYKSKHEVVNGEKVKLEGLLEVQVSDNRKLQEDLEYVKEELESVRFHFHDLEKEKDLAKSELDDVKMKFKNGLNEMVVKRNIPNESLEKIQFQVESVSNKLKKSLDFGESHLEKSEVILRYLSGLEIELQKMSLEDRNFVDQVNELEKMEEEFENSKLIISELKRENQDLGLELERMKEWLRCVNDELEVEKGIKGKLEGTIASLTSELESQRLELDQESENSRVVLEIMISEDLKLTFVKSQYESKIEELVKQCNELNKTNLDKDARLNDFFTENKKLSTTLESFRLKSEAKTLESNNASEQLRELQMKLQDMETRLNEVVESETRYMKENELLSRTIESVRLELQDSVNNNAEISASKNVLEISLMEVKNQHVLELGQLKDMVAKSEVEIGQLKELEMKLHDTESRLNHSLENEACYVKDNENLAKEVESVRLELEEVLESNNALKGKLGILEINLAEVKNQHEAEFEKYKELEMKLHETETRLNDYIEENKNLSTTLESVQLELKDSVAHNAEILESKNVLEGKMGILEINLTELKDELAKYESEVEKNKELQMKFHDTETRLHELVESESCYIEENKKLSRTLESVQLELKDSTAQNAEMSESIGQLKEMLVKSEVEIRQLELETELFNTKTRFDQFVKNEAFYIEENKSLKSELDAMVDKVTFLENNNVADIDDVLYSGQESDILLVVLKSKLYEQGNELITLKNKCSELAHKLSEQILKTEEFKNLSIYLKELKESSDVAREKKESEGPTESLRVAFIKEQYQAKLQELKQQLSVSKRHNEEMLFKLQDALDEIESGKKSEALQLKRIEELEAEVESVISQKLDHDRIQAEFECAILSLECCKEEKEKLVVLLEECEEEKSKLAGEVSLIKEQLAQKDKNGHVGVNGESEHPITPVNLQVIERGVHGDGEDEENSLVNDSKQLTVINDQFRAQHLRSYMDQLDEELEKMKNDNSILPLTNYDPGLQDLQKELSQLQKANEELGSIYPNFIDFPGNGNALERVLALEIELAEALRAKKKSNIQFQSSFLKQHSDEEAVFKSFRDINELIKDMLEIKGKYVNVESELKEMHDRYSQLSLQFAEVEGERQKLMMTLKNVRSSRNLLRLNRSSMAAIEDRPL